jgi:AcrR family transcriptional regulator
MESGRRSSVTARDKRDARADHSARASKPRNAPQQHIAPLYKRLPHGPHRLERNEVVLNQRARIHGAMVESIARGGYERTSVKQVIAFAGVSRRSFYEQFANKEECFLVTFDLIVRRDVKQMTGAFFDVHGTLEQRARAAFKRFALTADDDRNSTLLVVFEALRAGPAGVERLRRATVACEQMLARSFAESPGAFALPTPIVRGIAGGLHGAAAGFLRNDGYSAGDVDLADQMLRWTLLFQTPAAERMSQRMAAQLAARMREISSAYGNQLGPVEALGRDERSRLLQGMLRLVTHEDYRTLSAPQIADEANLPIDVFCELFDDKQQCFLAALDMIGDQLLTIAADPDLISDDWPSAVRRVLAELTRYLADHPLQARILTHEAFFAGPDALERTVELARSLATLLTEGAPAPAHCSLAVDAIAGALWHTVRCQVASPRVQLLAALSDHLAYVVLAPFIGADAAADIITQERSDHERLPAPAV